MADAVVARIVDAADGNPLFLEQLARHSVGVDPEVPDTVERVLAARIDTLAPADRQLLRDLSVLGRTGSADLAATWLGRPELADPARWAPLRQFVEVEHRRRAVGRACGSAATSCAPWPTTVCRCGAGARCTRRSPATSGPASAGSPTGWPPR